MIFDFFRKKEVNRVIITKEYMNMLDRRREIKSDVENVVFIHNFWVIEGAFSSIILLPGGKCMNNDCSWIPACDRLEKYFNQSNDYPAPEGEEE